MRLAVNQCYLGSNPNCGAMLNADGITWIIKISSTFVSYADRLDPWKDLSSVKRAPIAKWFDSTGRHHRIRILMDLILYQSKLDKVFAACLIVFAISDNLVIFEDKV